MARRRFMALGPGDVVNVRLGSVLIYGPDGQLR
jgi:hypothetical protein